MNRFKKTMQSIELPEDSKKAVREGINRQLEANVAEQRGQTGSRRRMRLPAMIAAVLAIAIVGTLLPAMLLHRDTESMTETVSFDGSDWVDGLFGSSKPYLGASGDVCTNDKVPDNGFAYEGVDHITEEVRPGFGAPTDEEPGAYPAVPEYPIEGGDLDYPSSQWGYGAGVLTAGRLDDNLHFYDFFVASKAFMTLAKRGFTVGQRIAVTVPGVANAKVALADENGTVMATARTDLNGVAYLHYNLRGEQYIPYRVGVSKDGRFAEANVEADGDGYRDVTLPLEGVQNGAVKLDLLLMLDTTGSMSDELEFIKVELQDMIRRVAEDGQVTDIRVSVNFYRDHGDEYVIRYFDFTDNIAECVSNITAQHANGGGDTPEAVDEALENAIAHQWREDAVKVMFIVLDAPAHSEGERQGVNDRLHKAMSDAAAQGIRIVPVVGSGEGMEADSDLESTMRTAAAVSGGKYLYLTDHSGIGGAHTEPVNAEPGVYYLNDLMVNTVLQYVIPGYSEEPTPISTEQTSQHNKPVAVD